ncbi:DUF2851 family protein [Mesonia sediminis]|uniref:DUF2851 family protein n=1 Tax=Mesonia sediminis TaxID=1703946 RepID=A0ABW5SA31_9FLAO
MKEDYLHYVWKFKKFNFLNLKTSQGLPIVVKHVGWHNEDKSGPDFFDARIQIDHQLWAGNVEIHLKASDWFAHHHHTDKAYDNVILHVVWEEDMPVYRSDGSSIPSLCLKHYVNLESLEHYQELSRQKKFINCENLLPYFSTFIIHSWQEKLYVRRLEQKTEYIQLLLKNTKNDWEKVLFILFAKGFGLNVNGLSFQQMAANIPFNLVRKTQKVQVLEALFMGMCKLLEGEKEDVYYQELQKEFSFLRHKYQLASITNPLAFFRLRPPNFPSIRLAQLAYLYQDSANFFNLLIEKPDIRLWRDLLFKVKTSPYWETHYNFEVNSKTRVKKLSTSFVDLMIINVLVPFSFSYHKARGKEVVDDLFSIMSSLKAEENSSVKKFKQLKPEMVQNAWHSQSLLSLYQDYCKKQKCLNCQIGVSLLNK